MSKKNKVTMNLSLSPEVKDLIVKLANEKGFSASAYITFLVLEDSKKKKYF